MVNDGGEIYKKRCMGVDDEPGWAECMSIFGSYDDEYKENARGESITENIKRKKNKIK